MRWCGVARPGAPIVISDEVPNLTDRMIGHKLGIARASTAGLSRGLMHLGDSFTAMVERIATWTSRRSPIASSTTSSFQLVWMGVGYVLVGTPPG